MFNYLCNQVPEGDDKRAAEVETFVPTKFVEKVAQLEEYTNTLYFRDNHRLVENYKFLKFNKFPFVSIFRRQDQILGFATSVVKESFPAKSIRLFNRFYYDVNYRTNLSNEFIRPTVLNCINQQLAFSKQAGFEYAFISREKAPMHFKKTTDELNKKSIQNNWEFRKGPFEIIPNSFQSVSVTQLAGTDNTFWSQL